MFGSDIFYLFSNISMTKLPYTYNIVDKIS